VSHVYLGRASRAARVGTGLHELPAAPARGHPDGESTPTQKPVLNLTTGRVELFPGQDSSWSLAREPVVPRPGGAESRPVSKSPALCSPSFLFF